jgi:hypothetical protein
MIFDLIKDTRKIYIFLLLNNQNKARNFIFNGNFIKLKRNKMKKYLKLKYRSLR